VLFGAPGEATTSEVGFAAKSGDVETVEYLLTGLGMKVDKKDSVGKLPIHWACYGGSVEVVQFLIKRGAKVHDKKGLPPLHIAASWGSGRPPLVQGHQCDARHARWAFSSEIAAGRTRGAW
jgi:ankyrin repeat protein